jgi:ATP-dependent Lon protease
MPEEIDPTEPAEAEEPATPAADSSAIETLPLVPLRDNVVFPGQVAPLAAGRSRSVAALEAAGRGDGRVVLAVQRHPDVDEVTIDDLCVVGVVAQVGALRRIGAGGAQALVEGVRRVTIQHLGVSGEAWSATVRDVQDTVSEGAELEALSGSVKSLFGDYVAAGVALSPDVAVAMARADEPARIADIASSAPDIAHDERMRLLEELDVTERLRLLVPILARQVEVAQLRSKIHEDVQRTITNTQREHILREQLRAVRKELAELGGGESDDEDLLGRVEAMEMPAEAKARLLKDVGRLEQIPSASPELGVVRNWIDLMLELPWGEPPPESIDIERTKQILDEDHYGLPKVKDRILEWLAVRQRTSERFAALQAAEAEAAEAAAAESHEAESNESDDAGQNAEIPEKPARAVRTLRTPILCLVGPPGVGKTSLGRSIARALDRKFVRLSLGGIRDEAEIRGHRRTYIGALPGRIIQSMRQAGAVNPVIMLDEVDKVGMDFRGDPSAALLEVLDPEQNFEFSDHYLEVAYDLSHVLFITTANLVDTISPPLRDRMEIIRITGYTEQEKLGIAREHLIPKQLEQHALDPGELEIPDDTLVALLHGYTREAGVRQLDRSIAELARKVPLRLASGDADRVVVKPAELEDLLGPQRFDYGEAQEADEIGAVTGVVVSDIGGDVVTVEAVAIPGRTELLLTGQIGNVMEESARAALSWAKVHAQEYGAPRGFFDDHGLHIHVPAGAIPKDGPSAGVTMTTAIISAASGRPVRRDVAMTGEVTLRGRVLPIGGVKDKLLAAHRAGIKTFILPRKNLRDLHEVDKEIRDQVEVIAVENVSEVLDIALLDAATRRDERRTGFLFQFPPSGPGIPTA